MAVDLTSQSQLVTYLSLPACPYLYSCQLTNKLVTHGVTTTSSTTTPGKLLC